MNKKIINIILSLGSLCLTIIYLISVFNRSSTTGVRAESANFTSYILIALFGVLTAIFATKAFKK